MSDEKFTEAQETSCANEHDVSLAKTKGRRRFIGAGVAASSTILTIASQPALGATCFTPSRSLSKNMSRTQDGQYGECNGVSPGNYKTQTNPASPAYHWPIDPGTSFHSLFNQGTFFGTYFLKTVGLNQVSMTLLEVLSLDGTNDPNKVAFHIIGAYLNALNGLLDSHITATLIQNIWNEYAMKNEYEVTAGVKWGGSQIVTYLKYNGIAP